MPNARVFLVRRLLLRAVVGAAALAATGAAGCGGPVPLDQLDRFATTEALGAEADAAVAWRPTPRDPVTLTLIVPARAAAGEPVPVRVRLYNGSPQPVTVGLGQYDDVQLVVARVDRPAKQGAVFGPPQLKRSTGGAVVTDPIRPGRDSTLEVWWPQTDDLGHRVPAGTYRLRAVVNAQLVSTRRLWTDWATVAIAP